MAVDPGSKYTGWVYYDVLNRKVVNFGVDGILSFYGILLSKPADVYVVERYSIRVDKDTDGYNHRWSNVEPAQLIGAIKFRAFQLEAEVVMQGSNIKPEGYILIGKVYVKGKPGMHLEDAYAHLAWYFHCKKGWDKEHKRHVG